MLDVIEGERRRLVGIQRVNESQEVREEPLGWRSLALAEEADGVEESVQATRKLLKADGERRVEKKQTLNSLTFLEDKVPGSIIGTDTTSRPATKVVWTSRLSAPDLSHIWICELVKTEVELLGGAHVRAIQPIYTNIR
jgi:hypothetical protein